MANGISKFLRVIGKGFSLSMSAEMVYKTSFILLVISIIFSDLIGPLIGYAIYSISAGIPGWTLMEFILLQGVGIFVFGIWHVFIGGISWIASDMTAEGDFDIPLTKPFSTVGYLMAQGIDFHGLTEVLVGLALIVWTVTKLHLINVILVPFIFLIILAIIFMFSISLILAALAVIFVRIWALNNLTDVLGMVSTYPMSVYSQSFRFFFTFIMPAAIAAYWPAAILLGKEPLSSMLTAVISVGIFLVFSLLLWKFALKRYQSAGG